jgi:hypothetical protein
MIVEKFVAGLIGSALGLVVAVAISHSPDQTDGNALSEPRPPAAAVCPKIEWPYGCDWHAAQTFFDASEQSQPRVAELL